MDSDRSKPGLWFVLEQEHVRFLTNKWMGFKEILTDFPSNASVVLRSSPGRTVSVVTQIVDIVT